MLPQLNIARREVDGSFNEEEPVSSQTFITTARERTVFMYSKLIECAIDAVLKPDKVFCWGVSWEVAVYYGIVNKQHMIEQRNSTVINEESFLRENQSVWTGNNSEAWFDSKRLNKRRTLLKCERRRPDYLANDKTFYVLGCDIARYSANTAIMVIKVLPGSESFQKKVVYTEVIHGANYITEQAPRIKELIELFQPREVVIDGNGRSKTWPTWQVIASAKPF